MIIRFVNQVTHNTLYAQDLIEIIHCTSTHYQVATTIITVPHGERKYNMLCFLTMRYITSN